MKCNIYLPSGNTTALIFGDEGLRFRNAINAYILRKYSEVEQVGFVFSKNNEYHLEMAGGEFCGNATRCAAYYFLDGKDGEIDINVSGVSRKLKAGIKDGLAYAEIPFLINSNPQSSNIKQLEGITHIIEQVSNNLHEEGFKNVAEVRIRSYLHDSGKTDKAIGVMFYNQNKDVYKLFPIVKVISTNTLYYETACGSGTACLGLYLHTQNKAKINKIPILQPSGKIIYVTIDFDESDNPISGYIEGIVEILQQDLDFNIDNM